MQTWLSGEIKKHESINDFIANLHEFRARESSKLDERKVLESFKYCLESLNVLDLISENENISFTPTDSLKPDFVLYAPETQSVVIVEVKNIANPTRQAGTEVSAYANEIKTYIPFISDGDIINVIVSTVWPTLLCHYIFHEIFWQQRNILCLQPVKIKGEIQLEIIDIKKIAQDSLSLKLATEHLAGYQICLYDDQLNTKFTNRARLDAYIPQMNAAMSAMASKANAQKNHGFAFLWKDGREITLAPYNITLINFSAFQSFERHFHNSDFEPNEIAKRFIRIIRDHDPSGHGNSLNQITAYGEAFLKGFCSPKPEGFLSWEYLREYMLENNRSLLQFKVWGVFEEIYSEKLLLSYQNGENDLEFEDPYLGVRFINELIDPKYGFIALSNYEDEDEDNDEDENG